MKRSLHFGLNELEPSFYGGWSGLLAGCVNDSRDMAVIAARAGFEARAVFNLDATVERLRAELSEVASFLQTGDTFWLSFSGHGGRVASPDWTGFTETLCFANSEVTDQALREMISKFRTGVRVVIDLDSCHAGGMYRGGRNATRNKPSFVKSTRVVDATLKDLTVSASVFVRAASQADELSSDGDRNGAYTAALLAVADAAVGTLTWSGWVELIQRYMAKESATQHPTANSYGAESDWNVSVVG